MQYFFLDIGNIVLKYIWKGKETRIDKTILKMKSERNHLPLFPKYYVIITIKTVWYWQRPRHREQYTYKQKRETRNIPTLMSNQFLAEVQQQFDGGKQLFNNGAAQSNIHWQKGETQPKSHTLYKY